MSTDCYLQFLEKNNKGQRVSVLTEAPIKISSASTGLPEEIRGRRFKSESEQTMERGGLVLPVVDIVSLKEYLFENSNGYNNGLNQSICVLGDPGMGKSAIVLDAAKHICETKYKGKREFVELAKLGSNTDKFTEVYNNPSNYYLFIDVRMTAYEKYELKGTPFPSKTQEGTMESLFETWMAVLFLPDAAGMLFLDEINQSDYGTQTALYGLLHKDERTIAGRAIANKEGWSVHGAGNLPEDKRGVQALLAALQERFKTVWLEVTFDTWIGWADNAKTISTDGNPIPVFHPLVMGFLKQMNEALDDEQFKTVFIKQGGSGKAKGLNAPNPRNFVALSEYIYSQDSIVKTEGKRLVDEVAELEASYAKLVNGTPAKARGYVQLEKKQKELDYLLDVKYLQRIVLDARAKINTPWARQFKRYIEGQNLNINDIFEFDNDEQSKSSITRKMTYASTTADGVSQGGTPQEVTNSMGQLKDMIQSIMKQFIENCGLGEYLTGDVLIPHAHGNKNKYDEFVANIPINVNKDINDDFKYISRIYTIINTQITENAKDLAAVTWSYLANAKSNDVLLFPLFQLAVDKNCTSQQKSKLKDERGQDIAFSKEQMKAAMSALNAKLKEDVQAYSTAKPSSSEEEEEGETTASLEDINILLKQSLKFLSRP